MEIDPRIAQTIVENIKGIIGHDINFFDTHGTMIASTDRSRIGLFHGAARLAAERKETVAVDDGSQFAGARNGINAPVMFNDTVAAVIGITGRRGEVEPFGNVITKMTEILIRENVDQITRFDQRLMTTNLINLLVSPQYDPGLVSYLASTLDVDLARPRRVAVGRCTSKDADHAGREGLLDVLDRWRSVTAGAHGALFTVSAQGFCVLLEDDGEATGDGAQGDVPTMLEDLRVRTERELGRPVSMGVGESAAAAGRYAASHRQARVAVDWMRFHSRAEVAFWEDLDAGVVVPSIPPAQADRFVAHVFAGVDDARIDRFHATFDAYTRHNGGIARAAEELFIHKNTLQNHLNDIAAATGYNPRNLGDHAILAAAFLLRDWRAFTS